MILSCWFVSLLNMLNVLSTGERVVTEGLGHKLIHQQVAIFKKATQYLLITTPDHINKIPGHSSISIYRHISSSVIVE